MVVVLMKALVVVVAVAVEVIDAQMLVLEEAAMVRCVGVVLMEEVMVGKWSGGGGVGGGGGVVRGCGRLRGGGEGYGGGGNNGKDGGGRGVITVVIAAVVVVITFAVLVVLVHFLQLLFGNVYLLLVVSVCMQNCARIENIPGIIKKRKTWSFGR